MTSQKTTSVKKQKIVLPKVACSKPYAISIAVEVQSLKAGDDIKHCDTQIAITALLKVRSYTIPGTTKTCTKSLRVLVKDDKILWRGNELILSNNDEVFELISKAINLWLGKE